MFETVAIPHGCPMSICCICGQGGNQVPTQRAANRGLTGHAFEFVDAQLGFILDSRIQRRLFRRVGSVRMDGISAGKTLKVCEAFAEDNDALGRDFIYSPK
jgi:hypothetical protein